MRMIKTTLGALVISSALIAGTVAAEEQALTAAQLQSSVLAGGCAGCHGTDGRLSGLPSRPAQTLETQLLNFKYDRIPSTVMGRIAKGFTDEELAEIARYFASVGN
ncbi:MAG: cytochrome c, class I [Natronospirillum sp.]